MSCDQNLEYIGAPYCCIVFKAKGRQDNEIYRQKLDLTRITDQLFQSWNSQAFFSIFNNQALQCGFIQTVKPLFYLQTR